MSVVLPHHRKALTPPPQKYIKDKFGISLQWAAFGITAKRQRLDMRLRGVSITQKSVQ